jgi:hypothetical protein
VKNRPAPLPCSPTLRSPQAFLLRALARLGSLSLPNPIGEANSAAKSSGAPDPSAPYIDRACNCRPSCCALPLRARICRLLNPPSCPRVLYQWSPRRQRPWSRLQRPRRWRGSPSSSAASRSLPGGGAAGRWPSVGTLTPMSYPSPHPTPPLPWLSSPRINSPDQQRKEPRRKWPPKLPGGSGTCGTGRPGGITERRMRGRTRSSGPRRPTGPRTAASRCP